MFLLFFVLMINFTAITCSNSENLDLSSSYEPELEIVNVTFQEAPNFNVSKSLYSFVWHESVRLLGNIKWESLIYYYIYPNVYENKILYAIRNLEENTCLKFERSYSQKREPTTKIMYKIHENVCKSRVGKQKSENTIIDLTVSCTHLYGTTAHETLHALGLRHEHQRNDRDEYITVNTSNVPNKSRFNLEGESHTFYGVRYDYSSIMSYGPPHFGEKAKNTLVAKNISLYTNMMGQRDLITFSDFKLVNHTFYGVRYDYSSIMSYGPLHFGEKAKNTLVAKNVSLYTNMMGQRDLITFSDFKLVNYHYCNCTFSEITCKNGGYIRDPRCGQCVCPKEYTGGKCEQIKDRSINCDLKKYNVSETSQMFESSGIRRCIHYFKTSNDSRIGIYLMYVNTKHKELCREDIGLEVKYLNDKGTTGLCLCGIYEDIFLFSESNEVVITYTGLESSNWFYGFYKKVLKSIKKEDEICYKDKCFIEPEKKPQEIPDKKLNTEKSIETTTTQQAKLHTEESLQEKPDIIEGPNCTPHC
uniref:Metalloendopeptidase n=1 Tax=Parastrongyloides trichosuri TaxID=131310 RepID=A0A0N5A5Q8_PARTI